MNAAVTYIGDLDRRIAERLPLNRHIPALGVRHRAVMRIVYINGDTPGIAMALAKTSPFESVPSRVSSGKVEPWMGLLPENLSGKQGNAVLLEQRRADASGRVADDSRFECARRCKSAKVPEMPSGCFH